MELDELITQVEEQAPSEEPLDRLASAMSVKADLDDVADALIGHFVDEARRAGCSWSEIGGAMGVSKQAAQQRHTAERPSSDWRWKRFGRWTPRARTVVREAGWAATRAGHEYLGTEHLLLGMLAVPEGIAGRILREAGVTADKVVKAMPAPTASNADRRGKRRRAPFTPRARQLIEGAHANAVRLNHNYIGTEHQLLAVFDDPESIAATVLLQAGLTKDAVEAQVRTILHGAA